MGKLFANLTDTDQLAKAPDRIGGGFEAFPTDGYDAVIKLAYVGKANRSSAQSITIVAEINGKELRETVWITNRNGENFYVDKNDTKKKLPLPGFALVDDICLLTTNVGLTDQDAEEKIVKIYNYVERKEVPTPVMCLTGLHGKPISLCVFREIVSKQKKDDSGEYKDTNETRTQNTIDKAVHPETKKTVNEYRNEVENAEFFPAWVEKNKGKDRDSTKNAAAGDAAAGMSGTGRPGGTNMFGGASSQPGQAAPKKTLFGK